MTRSKSRNERPGVNFTADTGNPGNRYRQSTTTPSPGVNPNGVALPGTPGNRTPVGSYNSQTGFFSGDYKGIGDKNNPRNPYAIWGGKRSRRRRRTRIRTSKNRRRH